MIPLFALILAAAQPVAAPTQADRPTDVAAALTGNCSAHKLEIPVTATIKGVAKQTKVALCGQIGQTDEQWVGTLKDARAKVVANPKMSASVKQQITTGLDREIARFAVATPPPAPEPKALAVAPPAASSLAPPAPAPVAASPLAEYSALPPLPTAKPAVVADAHYKPPQLLPRPRFTLRCFNPNDALGDVECNELVRDMQLTIRADEDMPAGTSLRFMRRGDARGEVELAQLRKGRSARVPLPTSVCAGVGGSRIEIQVLRRGAGAASGQVVDTLGPYELRC
jgi:hypothetical protein